MKLAKSAISVGLVLLGCLLAAAPAGCGGGGGGGTSGTGSGVAGVSGSDGTAIPANATFPVTLPSLRLTSTSASVQQSVPLTVGQAFPPALLQPADGLVGQMSDGKQIPVQVDAKATHADGSIRHAVLSTVVPALGPGQAVTLQLAKGGRSSAPAVAPGPLLDAGFTASVNILVDGIAYSASADALLRSGAFSTWVAGPQASEWLVSAPLTSAAGTGHPHLHARFSIRYYPAANRARVDVTVENAWAFAPGPRNFTYAVQVLVGGRTVYANPQLVHTHHARWRKTSWWGGEPEIDAAHDAAYLMASRALPRYDPSLQISAAALSALVSGWSGPKTEPMGAGQANPSMPDTGGRSDIGLIPGWAVMYLLSADRGARAVTFGTADLAGSWPIHYRDQQTGRPVSLANHPYMTLLGRDTDTVNPATGRAEAFPACGGDCSSPNTPDSPHQPAFSYLPYLLSGDHYHLEELQFWTMFNLFQDNPGFREAGKGLFKPDQVRGQAWSMRTLGEATWITPDQDPLKLQFAGFLSNNLDWYIANFPANPNANRLAILDTNEYAIEYDGGVGVAPWQDDFFTAAIGRLDELGFVKARPLLSWKATFPVRRMTDAGFCWIFASNYTLKVRDSASSPLYSSFAEIYRASAPAQASLPCGGAAMAAALGLQPGEMVGFSDTNIGYPSNLQPALAYGVNAGAPDAGRAWDVFMKRQVKPDYSGGPQFAVVPR